MQEERMNLDRLQSKLLTAARKAPPPSGAAPFAFEKRIMARITAQAQLDAAFLWNRILWRAAVPCLLVMFTASLWYFFAPNPSNSPSLGAELEEAVFAPAYAAIEETW
jgi:hypothetical protein